MLTNKHTKANATTGLGAPRQNSAIPDYRSLKPTAWILGFLALGLALCGCAGIHPYNQARDTAARQIQTNFNKIDLVSFIDKARTNLDVLRQEDLGASQQSILTEGDFRLLKIIESSSNLSDAFVSEMAGRFKALSGKTRAPANFDEFSADFQALIKNNYLQVSQISDEINLSASNIFSVAQKNPPQFDWTNLPPRTLPRELTNGLSSDSLSGLRTFYSNYLDNCALALDALRQLSDAFNNGGQDSVHEAITDWRAAIASLAAARNEAASVQADLNNVVDQYTNAAQTNAAFWKGDYTNAIKDVQQAVDKLKSVNAFGGQLGCGNEAGSGECFAPSGVFRSGAANPDQRYSSRRRHRRQHSNAGQGHSGLHQRLSHPAPQFVNDPKGPAVRGARFCRPASRTLAGDGRLMFPGDGAEVRRA